MPYFSVCIEIFGSGFGSFFCASIFFYSVSFILQNWPPEHDALELTMRKIVLI